MTDPFFASLQQACAAEGVILFTLSLVDERAALTRRIHTSHPQDYPMGGVKPMPRDAWYEACIAARAPFVANSPAEFAALFPDHAQITAMGLGSCVNIPVVAPGDQVIGTVNLLARTGHFTAATLQTCLGLVSQQLPALVVAMERALD